MAADPTLLAFTKEIDKELVPPLRQVLKGRTLVHVTEPKGFHITKVEWSKILEMSEGMVSYAFGSGNKDTLDFTPDSGLIPVYWKDFDVDRRMYEAFIANGIDIDTATALSAAFAAAKTENDAIIGGVKNKAGDYEIDGLFSGAGNDYDVSLPFSDFGNATKAVAGAKAILENAEVPDELPLNLLLNPEQKLELTTSRQATGGWRELDDVKDLLNGGNIISSPAIPSGNGLLMPTAQVGKPFLDFYLTKDWGTELGFPSEHPETGNLSGRVYSAGLLRIKQPEVLCTLSAI